MLRPPPPFLLNAAGVFIMEHSVQLTTVSGADGSILVASEASRLCEITLYPRQHQQREPGRDERGFHAERGPRGGS